jgi:hypothetical protein
MASQSHANRVKGFLKPALSERYLNKKAKRANDKASNRHHCYTCNKGFGTNSGLSRHKNTPSHKKKAAREAQASQ